MNRSLVSISLCTLFLFALHGCSKPAALPSVESAHDHVHDASDVLTWLKKESLPDSGHEIWLGHHGVHFHAGDVIEAAVAITSAGVDVGDAQLTNQLFSADDPTKSLSDEIDLVYEPKTPEEIAHYAQADLTIPSDIDACLIRFKITLPEAAEPIVRDVKITLGH